MRGRRGRSWPAVLSARTATPSVRSFAPARSFPPALPLALVLALPLSLASAFGAAAQFSAQPFFERADAVRHAFSLELMEARLSAAVALLESQGDEAGGNLKLAGELVDELLEEDLPLLAGSLARSTGPRLGQLEASIAELRQVVDDPFLEGRADELSPAFSDSVARVRDGIAAARDFLAPLAHKDPVLIAAVMSVLLLSDEGVAEAYQEAVAEDPEAYPQGWAALQAVHHLWSLLSPRVEERLRMDVEDALAELDRLLPAPRPTAGLTGDPEDAEEPAHRIVATLERISDAQLYPDRDLGRLARHTLELAQAGCQWFEAGEERLAQERVRAAQLSYQYLADLAGLLAQDAHAQVTEQFESLEAGEARSCSKLLDALDELRSVIGG